MFKSSAWQRLKQVFFQSPDERHRNVNAISYRNAYVAMLVTALSLSVYEGFAGRWGVLWPIVGINGVPLLFVLGYHLLLGGWGSPDERVR